MTFFRGICFFLFTTLGITSLYGDLTSPSAAGITLDLREPYYNEGTLITEKGGVIQAPHIRIQALKLCYTHGKVNEVLFSTIQAENQLMIEVGDYIFVGDKLFYDMEKKEGWIINGRTKVGPWYLGGERIEIRSDGSYLIYEGFATTSENVDKEWKIYADKVYIYEKRYVSAYGAKLQILHFPIFYLPSLKADLTTIFDSPIRYHFKWGGIHGPRFGFTYEIFSWHHFKTFIRCDYRLTKGPGFGIDAYYHSLDYRTEYESMSYIAPNPFFHERSYYHFKGRFKKILQDPKWSLLVTYDKLSDPDLRNIYHDRDFNFETSDRTQLLIRRHEPDWIGQLYAHIRVNNFETIKEELPTYSLSFRPFLIGQTGIIVENQAKVSYLNFKYANFLHHVRDYASTRLEYKPTLYKPISFTYCTFTPQLGAIAIFYGNSPEKKEQCLLIGSMGYYLKTRLYRYYETSFKHVIEPYTSYHYYTYPTYSPYKHFIFDINDGYYYLNQFTFGVKNSLYLKDLSPTRLFYFDLYTHLFPATSTLPLIPKIYMSLSCLPFSHLRVTLDAAWDIQHHLVDHINICTAATVNDNLAFTVEYRHRSAYSWRKVDPHNFFLDTFHSIPLLLNSPLSDRRDTVLLHSFYRFHPNWAIDITTRYGCHRKHEPSYLEYKIDLSTTIQTAWNLKLSFQHRERDNRIALYINLGLPQPLKREESPIYNYD